MITWLQWLLTTVGLVAIISYVLEILTFLVLWMLIGFPLLDSAFIASVSSWVLLPFIPVGIYFVKKRISGRR